MSGDEVLPYGTVQFAGTSSSREPSKGPELGQPEGTSERCPPQVTPSPRACPHSPCAPLPSDLPLSPETEEMDHLLGEALLLSPPA